ncbi:NADP-dependent oxidoreductase [Lacticaseibacillus porcinae]|uniref:NADP-dependent oxidoreductase n=1 Tax=Lacticaseibacillus porcinae TaxID=1123687 RepID=UPI000F7B8F2D|nr:NADP-dependent oxidoreductase [Lacticaseibacillus porcinae]
MPKMTSFMFDRYGKHPFAKHQVAIPTPAANEVLVQIKAASVNPVDIKKRNGDLRFLLPEKHPAATGHDFAGVVTAVGTNVTDFTVGQRVFGKLEDWHIGSFADFVCVNTKYIAEIPTAWSFEQAAAVPLVALTSYQALHDNLQLKPGQSVLIPGGSGGIGSIAIPMAKALGARVTTTASPKNFARLQQLGADVVLDYHDGHALSTQPQFDAIFDTRGGDDLLASFALIKPNGRLVSLNAIPEARFIADQGAYYHLNGLKRVLLKLVSAKHTRLARKQHIWYRFMLAKSSGKQLQIIAALMQARHIPITIDRKFDFEDTQAALDYVESGHAQGKVVIIH